MKNSILYALLTLCFLELQPVHSAAKVTKLPPHLQLQQALNNVGNNMAQFAQRFRTAPKNVSQTTAPVTTNETATTTSPNRIQQQLDNPPLKQLHTYVQTKLSNIKNFTFIKGLKFIWKNITKINPHSSQPQPPVTQKPTLTPTETPVSREEITTLIQQAPEEHQEALTNAIKNIEDNTTMPETDKNIILTGHLKEELEAANDNAKSKQPVVSTKSKKVSPTTLSHQEIIKKLDAVKKNLFFKKTGFCVTRTTSTRDNL